MGNKLTLGSLFSGSGGFELGGLIYGITPLWASEIEPFPIRVTTRRLPQVKHYGDVSKLSGGELPPVDIITFGSPCQDMSIAGKRRGLGGERSGLFFEAVRIVTEMRDKTNGKYPRFVVWENVQGAFSSNKGEDFRCVLESLCRIKDADAHVPAPDKGKWNGAGSIVGDSYSVAWRTLDAQYWGVSQRRKRIYLVANFAGECAGKILFESEGLSGYSAESFRAWQGTACRAEEGTGTAGCICLNDQGGSRMDITEEKVCTLRAESHHPPCVMEHTVAIENHGTDSRVKICEDGVVQTLTSRMGTGGNNVPMVAESRTCFDVRFTSEGTRNARQNCYETATARTIDTSGNPPDCNHGGVAVVYGICSKDSNSMKSANPKSGFYEAETSRCLDGNGGNPTCSQGGMAVVAVQGSMIGRDVKNGPQGSGVGENVSFTLNTADRHAVAYGIDRAAFNQGQNAKFGICIEPDVEPPMTARGANAIAQPTYSTSKGSFHTEAAENIANTLMESDYKEPPTVSEAAGGSKYIVRRLTPVECARLQGFPDWWCDGLGEEEPPEKEIAFWREVFETHRLVMGTSSKQKNDRQIVKWLQNPYSDSAAYRMWGNGVALPNVCFVLAGIAYFAQK